MYKDELRAVNRPGTAVERLLTCCIQTGYTLTKQKRAVYRHVTHCNEAETDALYTGMLHTVTKQKHAVYRHVTHCNEAETRCIQTGYTL